MTTDITFCNRPVWIESCKTCKRNIEIYTEQFRQKIIWENIPLSMKVPEIENNICNDYWEYKQ